MELSAFATRIHTRLELGEQRLVELSTGEFAVQLRGIDADEARLESMDDELPSKPGCVQSPQRKNRSPPRSLKQPLAIRAHVREKQIPECNVACAREPSCCVRERGAKRCFIARIRRRLLQLDDL